MTALFFAVVSDQGTCWYMSTERHNRVQPTLPRISYHGNILTNHNSQDRRAKFSTNHIDFYSSGQQFETGLLLLTVSGHLQIESIRCVNRGTNTFKTLAKKVMIAEFHLFTAPEIMPYRFSSKRLTRCYEAFAGTQVALLLQLRDWLFISLTLPATVQYNKHQHTLLS